jgi:hypothetical protein
MSGPVKFVPDVDALSREHHRSAIRGIIGIACSKTGDQAAEVVRRQWRDDARAISIAERGAVVPFATTTTGAPVETSISGLITLMGPKRGAFAGVASRAPMGGLTFDRAATLRVPNITVSGTGISFINQSSPFPIRQLVTSGTDLTPMKVAVGFGMSSEMLRSTNVEAYVSAVVRENILTALDTIFLDATASSATRPAGLRNGVSAAGTATANGGIAALAGDLGLAADAVSGVAGSDIVYCMSVKDYIRAKTLSPLAPVTILPTSGVANGTIISVGLPGIAIAGSSEAIRIERSEEATVHFEADSPLAINAGTFAAPVLSAWQMDIVVLRLVCDLTWATRASASVSYISSITW